MIFSSIYAQDSMNLYPKGIQKALTYLKENDITQMELGTYPIQGKDIYVLVMDVKTLPLEDRRPEAHKNYIDIQFVARGEEMLGFAPDMGTAVLAEENADKDLYFYANCPGENFLVSKEGCFCIFFPYDLHRPGCMAGSPQKIRKAVVKVHVDALYD